MLSWEYDEYIRSHIENLISKLPDGCKVYILHIADVEYINLRENKIHQGLATDIKTNLHVITSVFSSLGDYARAISRIKYEVFDFDIIHAHDWMSGIPSIIAKLAYIKPFVLTFYRLGAKNNDKNLISLSIEGFERYSCNQADALILHDKGLRKYIFEAYGIPWEKIYVTPEWDGIVDIYKEVLEK